MVRKMVLSLMELSMFSSNIVCLEEIAFNQHWISAHDLKRVGKELNKTSYGQYLLSLVVEKS